MATADSMSRTAAAKKAAAAAKKKKAIMLKGTAGNAPRSNADRLSSLKRTGTTAGKASGTMGKRAMQNAGVKDGTIRIGAKGKAYNVYDAKTATWKRGIVSVPGKKGRAKVSSKTIEPRTDRLSKPFPHKEGYKTAGAEGNKWITKKK